MPTFDLKGDISNFKTSFNFKSNKSENSTQVTQRLMHYQTT